MADVRHLTMEELEAGLDDVRKSPRDEGVLQLIVRRPQTGERQVLEEGQLDLIEGLAGDDWRARGSSLTSDGSPHPDMQLTLMNSRVIALVAQAKDRYKRLCCMNLASRWSVPLPRELRAMRLDSSPACPSGSCD